ncbi:efflux RND transporter periplasmic adaptor subunit [Endozoicomonas arenosclerae]|uniref:efflux RND transporter periplasmic adaptor subunit n=1 Tax=Endozoicomonas arenosclerae TaxID=1633495 RepID=UPI0007804CC3|nr:efflux RND transporter periplasmic adaptor subunit [Endozoicomonas arenosclerae]
MKNWILMASVSVVAFAAGIGVKGYMDNGSDGVTVSTAKEPLYWVAPMDPNYKRDKPGKSPMGMDLVPVYEEEKAEDKPGTISVSSAVANSLGVRSEQVIEQTLQSRISTVGLVGYDEDSLRQVNSRVEGWIKNLQVSSQGEFVSKGSKLFDLYSPALVSAQEELLSAARSGNQGFIKASKDRLLALGVSDQVIRRIIRNKNVEQTLSFYAPEDGYISQMNTREGGYVNPSKTILELASLDAIWVVADVFESQSQQVKAGQKAAMSVDYIPGKEWLGTVDYIYPELDLQTRSLRVRLRFDNPGGELKPNMFSRVSIFPESFKALSIPVTAVLRMESHNRVVKDLGEGRFRSARVELGREIGNRVEVLEGLNSGDRVVTSAQFLLDSESSINADLSRIEGAPKESVWIEGTFQAQKSAGVINVAHGPVKEWGWPGMIMDFNLSPDLAMPELAQGQAIRFETEKLEAGGYQVNQIEIIEASESSQPESSGGMDHSGHDMSGMNMDHSGHDMSTMERSGMGMKDESRAMDHSQHEMPAMDHSTMDHGDMDHSMMGH